ncbi:hypothetical protein D3C72_2590190 [compost metagenome]
MPEMATPTSAALPIRKAVHAGALRVRSRKASHKAAIEAVMAISTEVATSQGL